MSEIISIHLVFIHIRYFRPQCNLFIISLFPSHVSAVCGNHQVSLFAKTVSLHNMCNFIYNM
jgi:hypothetical protein